MAKGKLHRRDFLKASLATAALTACRSEEKSKPAPGTKKPAVHSAPLSKPSPSIDPDQKVLVLGFDGVDPRLAERWMASGDLPNLSALAKKGFFSPLGSTSPPNSPVAWSSFASGQMPTGHGVFGFLKRDPDNYLPGTAPYTVSPPRFRDGAVVPARAVSHRQGPAWWNILDRKGVGVELLWVPYAFPPPELKNGRSLSGLGTPDGRFTNSSFTHFTSEVADGAGNDRVAGGRIVRLTPTGTKIETTLDGPRGPDKKALKVPLTIDLDRTAGSVEISMGGKKEKIGLKKRSGWFPVAFTAPGFQLNGRVRFHLLALKKSLSLYASPIQLDPGQAIMPLGTPPDWAKKSVMEHGLPTVGWVHDTSAVNAGVLPREAFLGAILDTMEARAALLYKEMATSPAQVLTAVFTGTDRAAHIFYSELERPDGGPLRTVYQAMDKIVGQVLKRLTKNTSLMVISDHGFHDFSQQLHVNTWLEKQGWLKRSQPGGKVNFLRGINWQETKAYSMGNGQLYTNLKGREGSGTVVPGPERTGLLAEISKRLLDWTDPGTGQKPVRAIYPVADKTSAALKARAPDLQIAFRPGWRNSWATTLGGAPSGALSEPNPKAWCGDHAASDVAQTPGVLFSDQQVSKKDPHLIDLAATLLDKYGAQPIGPGQALWK